MSELPPIRSAIILLAAGNSSRMGGPKQLLPFRGKPLLRHAAEVALSSDCEPVVVVLGFREQDTRTVLSGLAVEITINGRWAEGMGTSIQAGLHAISSRNICGVILTVGDQPFVTSGFLRRLLVRHQETGKNIVASRYSGTAGVPVFFSLKALSLLHSLQPNQGCKGLIFGKLNDTEFEDCPEAAIDIDTPEDYLMLMTRPGIVEPL